MMNEFLQHESLDWANIDNQPYFIGMMSGTSLDALDAVLCRFDDERPVVIESHSVRFPDDLKAALLALTVPNGVSDYIQKNYLAFESELDVFGWASVFYGELAASVVLELLHKAKVETESVCAIGCHGQTVRHRPKWHFSLQLLDPNVLTERTGIAVVSDFRRRDMAVGGQGAPLAPAFHEAIFNDFDDKLTKAVLNLGGIANITLLSDGEREVIGFDTGCANLLLDGWTKRHTGADFDKDGELAKSGKIITSLLEQLLSHPFFKKPYPKSTGREEFNLEWLDAELAKFDAQHGSDYTPQDVQATLIDLTAVSVADALTQVSADDGELFVCGGGALNDYLMTRLSHHLPAWQVQSTDALGFPPTLVESLAFAWLARQTILSQVGNLPSVTGADRSVVLGQVCFP
ncbi:anhydro-N-acetylmuramic acid kinase [Moraxella ovis]|uniref:anhydro-N-acetylmuramic acid kinase n=1 Tax=Moraxella ovis TaxID=29433 RepID=UPI000D97380B|nr:anhydro-N-acetylmuramic acid kinase [Moraxella ovis]SPX80783.1 Anhydro-N-acetylmuramic acid kinase [Moraxella ovis]STZ06096.1 Anhydro-N-acetylmuramic acid kinase [Moraxella ovis]